MIEEPPYLTLTLCFDTPPNIDLKAIGQCIAALEPLRYPPEVLLFSSTPLSLSIVFDQDDPHHCGLPHLHNIEVNDSPHPIPDTLSGTVHLHCTYYSGGSYTPEPMIALYKVAYCFKNQGLLGIWDEAIAVYHSTEYLACLFEQKNLLKTCRNEPPEGLWTNLLEFHRPSGGVWFYTKGQYRFNIPDFAYLGPSTHKTFASQLFREVFFGAFQSRQSPNVGDRVEVHSGVWISVNSLLEYEDILESPLGTRVLQIHHEDQPYPEQEDAPFYFWVPPQI